MRKLAVGADAGGIVSFMDFSALLQQSAAHAWLYLPTALLLGALHGLEPGHSKTMMAAFIIAVRGTVTQAALLGLSAAFSHSLIIWALAAAALRYGSQWNVESTEPYLQLGTGIIVVGLAVWTLWRIRRERRGGGHHHHHHHDESKTFATEWGEVRLDVFEDGVPPRFRLNLPAAIEGSTVTITTRRAEGVDQEFAFVAKPGFLESVDEIPEPHEFTADITITGEKALNLRAEFVEGHGHTHGPDDEEDDAHARMHAEQIRTRFTGRHVTTGQIVMFGLTGGLMPCPAAFSILLICLQLKKFTLGFALVGAFSLGLALTLVTVGVVAAWSLNKATKASPRIANLARNAPYLSSGLLILLGLFLATRGLIHLA